MALANINVPAGGGKKTPAIMLSLPSQSGTLTYSGSAQSPTWSGYDATQLTISGTTSATNAGTYTATFTLKDGYTWVDGTSNPGSVTWTIGKAAANLTALSSSVSVDAGKSTTFAVTTASDGTLTVTSSNTSVATATISGKTITVTGVVSGGTATITVSQTATANYAAGTATCAITINKTETTLKISSTSGTVTYGEAKTFTVTTNSDGAIIVSSSNTSVATATISDKTVTVTSTGAGTATITVSQTATANYAAPAPKTYNLTVNKAKTTLSLSETSGVIFGQGNTVSFDVITPSDGEITTTISLTGSTTTIPVTATVDGTTVTITNIFDDWISMAYVNVSQAAGTNHKATTKNASYKVIVHKGKLITDSWSTISTRSKNGTAANYYSLGDYKEITLNGKIGDRFTLENQKLYVYILHFNLPMNGTPENNIIWGGFAVDTVYSTVSIRPPRHAPVENEIATNMNHAFQDDDETANGYKGTNYGGWKGCDFRYDILGATSTPPSEYNQRKSPSNIGYDATAATLTNPKADTLLAALPADFRNVLRLWSRWIDAKGNSSNTEAAIEETIDAVTLLAEFEIRGSCTYANQYEQNHQTQMALYQLTNAYTYHCEYPDGNVAVDSTWLASPSSTSASNFVYIYDAGIRSAGSAETPMAIAPAFKV